MKNFTYLLVFFLCLTLFSCRKRDANPNFQGVDSEAQASFLEKSMESDIDGLSYKVTPSGELNKANCASCAYAFRIPTCATVSEDTNIFPRTVTIDYGASCTDFFGREKAGKLHFYITDDLVIPGAQRVLTFENFSVNGWSFEGTRTILNSGFNSVQNLEFQRTVDLEFTKGSDRITRNFEGEIEWSEGYGNPGWGSNVFLISGSGNHQKNTNAVVHFNITKPLKMDRSCLFLTQGVFTLDNAENKLEFDYGNGNCDAEATVQVNDNKTYRFNLRTYQIID